MTFTLYKRVSSPQAMRKRGVNRTIMTLKHTHGMESTNETITIVFTDQTCRPIYLEMTHADADQLIAEMQSMRERMKTSHD